MTTKTKEHCYLLADIGATNVRFALAHDHDDVMTLTPSSVWLTALHTTLDEALHAYLDQQGRPKLDAVAVCAAGPIEGEGRSARIRMTNCPWDVSVASLVDATGIAAPLLMNDFAALALSVPHLADSELRPLGGSEPPSATGPKVVIGAGTGLGVGSLVWGGSSRIAIPGEGGHIDLAPGNAREIAVLHQLMLEYGHVSAERVLSGPGLVSLYRALASLSGAPPASNPMAVDIAARARAGSCPLCVETISLFCGWLGAVAGDLALILGAHGGVYVGGGIVPGWIATADADGKPLFDAALFRRRFEAKGRFAPYMARIPIFVMMREDPALLGLAHAAAGAIMPPQAPSPGRLSL